jgi:sulfide:quinone oxidoreductase
VLGAGFERLEAAFYMRKRLGKRAAVTVVSPSDHFLFKPNTIYVPFGKSPDELLLDLRPVFDRRHIEFVEAVAEGVDHSGKRVKVTPATSRTTSS